MRIGLLSDTHVGNRLPDVFERVREALRGVDLILHGGDIVAPYLLDWLEELAPTLAARGNNDTGFDDPRMRDLQLLDCEGWRLAMVHDMEPEERPIAELRQRCLGGEDADVFITGHTHFERLTEREGVVQINSGSPNHPHLWSTRLGTIGFLSLSPGRLEASVVRLGETEGLRNPGEELFLAVER